MRRDSRHNKIKMFNNNTFLAFDFEQQYQKTNLTKIVLILRLLRKPRVLMVSYLQLDKKAAVLKRKKLKHKLFEEHFKYAKTHYDK